MTEVVLVSDETSRDAHKNLYNFQEDAYIIAGGDLLEDVRKLSGDFNRLHIALIWEDILRLALWKLEPTMGDVFVLLRNIGIRPEELLPFKEASISDIFPWLYYGRRFDVLKKLCFVAKSNVGKYIKNKDISIHCHMVSGDTTLIVASTL